VLRRPVCLGKERPLAGAARRHAKALGAVRCGAEVSAHAADSVTAGPRPSASAADSVSCGSTGAAIRSVATRADSPCGIPSSAVALVPASGSRSIAEVICRDAFARLSRDDAGTPGGASSGCWARATRNAPSP
jgi:hypothetical protein